MLNTPPHTHTHACYNCYIILHDHDVMIYGLFCCCFLCNRTLFRENDSLSKIKYDICVTQYCVNFSVCVCVWVSCVMRS